ncbi:MAG: phosphatidylglycerophosphatase A [Nitrospirae bacterium]|nr:phosphatidylglycerophosphatase A [Nitrospirota bacterium]
MTTKNNLKVFLTKAVASVFFIGHIPFAPGTFGTLAAVAFVWIVKPDSSALIIISAVLFLAGTASAHYAETCYNRRDSGNIVIDEFAGYLVSIMFLPLTTGYIIAAFFIFRFFDIVKPSPIRNVEQKLHGGLGVMTDDLLAGIATNIVLQIWRVI